MISPPFRFLLLFLFDCKKAGLQVGLLNALELALLHALECELHVPVDAVSDMLGRL